MAAAKKRMAERLATTALGAKRKVHHEVSRVVRANAPGVLGFLWHRSASMSSVGQACIRLAVVRESKSYPAVPAASPSCDTIYVTKPPCQTPKLLGDPLRLLTYAVHDFGDKYHNYRQ